MNLTRHLRTRRAHTSGYCGRSGPFNHSGKSLVIGVGILCRRCLSGPCFGWGAGYSWWLACACGWVLLCSFLLPRGLAVTRTARILARCSLSTAGNQLPRHQLRHQRQCQGSQTDSPVVAGEIAQGIRYLRIVSRPPTLGRRCWRWRVEFVLMARILSGHWAVYSAKHPSFSPLMSMGCLLGDSPALPDASQDCLVAFGFESWRFWLLASML